MNGIPLAQLIKIRDVLAEVKRLPTGEPLNVDLWCKVMDVSAHLHIHVELILAKQTVDVVGSAS